MIENFGPDKYDQIFQSLDTVSRSVYLLDNKNRERIREILDAITDDEPLEARLISLLHHLVSKNIPLTPFLLTVHLLNTQTKQGVLLEFLKLFDHTLSKPDDSMQFIRICWQLMDSSPASLSPWLLLIHRFKETKLPLELLKNILTNLQKNYRMWHPGDSAALILHLLSHLERSGLSDVHFLHFCEVLETLDASIPDFLQELITLYPLPLTQEMFEHIPSIRRLAPDITYCQTGDTLFAIPLEMKEGILPPGCLKWFTTEGDLLRAGYFLPISLLPIGTHTITIDAEDFFGNSISQNFEIAVSSIHSKRDSDPHFFHKELNQISNVSGMKTADLFFGYLEGVLTREIPTIAPKSDMEMTQIRTAWRSAWKQQLIAGILSTQEKTNEKNSTAGHLAIV